MWRKEEKRKKKGMQLGKYELGRTLGEGNFGKVKYAKDIESGQGFAVKILEKKRILDLKIADQVIISAPPPPLPFSFLIFPFPPCMGY